ncbi:hypothetical protein AHF37_04086 [Paragonimus kellicotti]|nr:hypothetical protein AHF37_04086 [Paragonimus kellicotti]
MFVSQLSRSVIRGLHHNLLLAVPHVSSTAELIITGDLRGLLVASRYNSQLTTYSSSVLTVIPGSILDMQAHGSLLLITGRSFPTDQNREDDEAVEIVNSRSLIYFLFDVTSKHLSKLELTALLPPELHLR